ncbi:MAG TPA: sensor histidine kinase [Clostridia bacterium]|nr:sensor histidine kinase [Clostridia bacterium]
MLVLMLVTVFGIEVFYIAGYRQTLVSGAQTLMNAKIDQLFTDIRDLWHELTLLSSTVSRSDAMREFVLSPQPYDERVTKNLRASISLAQLASDEVVSLMVTDFGDLNLFAYGVEDYAVLAHARNAIAQGLVIKSPVHLQMGHGEQAVTYCVNCTDPNPDGQPLYTVLVYNLGPLRQAFAAMADTTMSILLLDGADEVVMSNRPHQPEEIDELLRIARDNADARRHEMQVRRLSLLRWQLVAMLDSAAETERMQPVLRFALWTNLFILAGLTAFFLVLRKQINTPVLRMLQYMKRVAAGQTRARLELSMRNELSAIQDGMNDMLDRLEAMTRQNQRAQERLFELRLAQTKAEIAALTSQINPHFLFNTFDCMRGIAAVGDKEKLETAIDALAAIFRHATRGAPDVPLAEEMCVIEQYMAIVRIRHGGRIEMASRISPEAEDCPIPKMILQPLVENAVLHGLETVGRKGLLTIEARVEDGMLVIVVEDNGKGLTEAELEHLRAMLERGESESMHIGLSNIHKRLRLRYGFLCGLTVQGGEDSGMRVEVRIIATQK